jgi:hypothetical protein
MSSHSEAVRRRRRQPEPGGPDQHRLVGPLIPVFRAARGQATLKLALLGGRSLIDRLEELFPAGRVGCRRRGHDDFS